MVVMRLGALQGSRVQLGLRALSGHGGWSEGREDVDGDTAPSAAAAGEAATAGEGMAAG
jgi:hypothetical protein